MGIPHDPIAQTGLIGRMGETNRNIPAIALRADIDALPIQEATGLKFSSHTKGMMHACGHDGHIAIVTGAAALLIKHPPQARTVLLYQPAEESRGGAQTMIKEGALRGIDMIFGGHIDTHYPAGVIAIRRDIESAYTDAIRIDIKGRGGHAARPHEARDAVYASSALVIAMQGIVSRGTDPLEPAVLSIGSLHSGTAHNVISEEAELEGTLRTTDDRTRRDLIKKIKDTADAIARLHGVLIKVRVVEGYPPTINHPLGFEIALNVARELLGPKKVIVLDRPSMGGEDFSYFLQKVPGCFVRIGAAKKGAGLLSAHSPAFDFDEEAIRVGAEYYAALVRAVARQLKK